MSDAPSGTGHGVYGQVAMATQSSLNGMTGETTKKGGSDAPFIFRMITVKPLLSSGADTPAACAAADQAFCFW